MRFFKGSALRFCVQPSPRARGAHFTHQELPPFLWGKTRWEKTHIPPISWYSIKKIIGAEYIKIPFTPQLLLYLNNNNADHKALSIFNLTCKSLPNHRKRNSIVLEWPFQQSFTIPLICQEWLLEHKPQLSFSSGAFPVQDNLPHSLSGNSATAQGYLF